MTDLRSMSLEEINGLMETYGEKKYRAGQVYGWLNKKLAASFDEMTNLPKDLRRRMAADCVISKARMIEKLVSKDASTTKYLFELEKDTIIESVLMKYSYGNSICVSSQAGCRMGCAFCASGLEGLERNLTAGELCAQVYGAWQDLGRRVSHIVVMGSGEPFDNYDNLLKFIGIITSEAGLNIGARHITVSTCGLADKILRFAKENIQVNLAVSLHAPNDSIRRSLMPVANKYSVAEVIEASNEYSKATGRRVTYEYALVAGVNDDAAHARELARRLKAGLSHVNLIPLNPVAPLPYKKSAAAQGFAAILSRFGVEATIRRELGCDIDGACGQLRRRYSGSV